MPNRPFSFYFRNDGGIAKVMGVEPLDNNYIYHIKPGRGSVIQSQNPIKIDVHTDNEELVTKGQFSFILQYSDQSGDIHNLAICVKKMDVKSIIELKKEKKGILAN